METLNIRAPHLWGWPEIIRYVPIANGWHVYLRDFDPFPMLWAATLPEAVQKGRELAAKLGYKAIKEKLEDYK